MNKLYYMALGLGLAFSLSQTWSLAQQVNNEDVFDVQPQAPSSQLTGNGYKQQPFSAAPTLPLTRWSTLGNQSSNQVQGLQSARAGGLANGSAAGQGNIPSGDYNFGFTGGGGGGHGGYGSLPPTSTSSCLGIDILGDSGSSGTGMGGVDSGAGAAGAAASTSPAGVGGGTGATISTPPDLSGF